MYKMMFFLTKLVYKKPNRIYKDIIKFTLYNGTDIEIIIFSERNPLYIGQATIFNTIIVEESIFSRYNNSARNYIITHEYAHTKQSVLSIIGILSGVILLMYLIKIFQQHSLYITYGLISSLIEFSLIAVGVISVFSWIIEIDADYYAIKLIGKDIFLDAKHDLKSKAPQRTFFQKFVIRMTHPPLWFTIKIYDCFNKNEKIDLKTH